jgi:hypothetical protein
MATLTSGTASILSISTHAITVRADKADGGTAPDSFQWEYNYLPDGKGFRDARGTGVDTRSATIRPLFPSSAFRIRLRVTDAAGSVAYSNVIRVKTKPAAISPELTLKRV